MDVGAVLITFRATFDAFAFEDAARTQGLPGRLIPLPSAISASCGLAWKLPADITDWPALAHEGVFRYGSDHVYHRLDD